MTSDTKSALIDPFSFLVVSSRRDVPAERLYKNILEKFGCWVSLRLTQATGDRTVKMKHILAAAKSEGVNLERALTEILNSPRDLPQP